MRKQSTHSQVLQLTFLIVELVVFDVEATSTDWLVTVRTSEALGTVTAVESVDAVLRHATHSNI